MRIARCLFEGRVWSSSTLFPSNLWNWREQGPRGSRDVRLQPSNASSSARGKVFVLGPAPSGKAYMRCPAYNICFHAGSASPSILILGGYSINKVPNKSSWYLVGMRSRNGSKRRLAGSIVKRPGTLKSSSRRRSDSADLRHRQPHRPQPYLYHMQSTSPTRAPRSSRPTSAATVLIITGPVIL